MSWLDDLREKSNKVTANLLDIGTNFLSDMGEAIGDPKTYGQVKEERRRKEGIKEGRDDRRGNYVGGELSEANQRVLQGDTDFHLSLTKDGDSDAFNPRRLAAAAGANTWDGSDRLFYNPWAGDNEEDVVINGAQRGFEETKDWIANIKNLSNLERKQVEAELAAYADQNENQYLKLAAWNTISLGIQVGAFEESAWDQAETTARTVGAGILDIPAGLLSIGSPEAAEGWQNIKEQYITGPIQGLTEEQHDIAKTATVTDMLTTLGVSVGVGVPVRAGTKALVKNLGGTTLKNVTRKTTPLVTTVAAEEAVWELQNLGRGGELDPRSAALWMGAELGFEAIPGIKNVKNLAQRIKNSPKLQSGLEKIISSRTKVPEGLTPEDARQWMTDNILNNTEIRNDAIKFLEDNAEALNLPESDAIQRDFRLPKIPPVKPFKAIPTPDTAAKGIDDLVNKKVEEIKAKSDPLPFPQHGSWSVSVVPRKGAYFLNEETGDVFRITASRSGVYTTYTARRRTPYGVVSLEKYHQGQHDKLDSLLGNDHGSLSLLRNPSKDIVDQLSAASFRAERAKTAKVPITFKPFKKGTYTDTEYGDSYIESFDKGYGKIRVADLEGTGVAAGDVQELYSASRNYAESIAKLHGGEGYNSLIKVMAKRGNINKKGEPSVEKFIEEWRRLSAKGGKGLEEAYRLARDNKLEASAKAVEANQGIIVRLLKKQAEGQDVIKVIKKGEEYVQGAKGQGRAPLLSNELEAHMKYKTSTWALAHGGKVDYSNPFWVTPQGYRSAKQPFAFSIKKLLGGKEKISKVISSASLNRRQLGPDFGGIRFLEKELQDTIQAYKKMGWDEIPVPLDHTITGKAKVVAWIKPEDLKIREGNLGVEDIRFTDEAAKQLALNNLVDVSIGFRPPRSIGRTDEWLEAVYKGKIGNPIMEVSLVDSAASPLLGTFNMGIHLTPEGVLKTIAQARGPIRQAIKIESREEITKKIKVAVDTPAVQIADPRQIELTLNKVTGKKPKVVKKTEEVSDIYGGKGVQLSPEDAKMASIISDNSLNPPDARAAEVRDIMNSKLDADPQGYYDIFRNNSSYGKLTIEQQELLDKNVFESYYGEGATRAQKNKFEEITNSAPNFYLDGNVKFLQDAFKKQVEHYNELLADPNLSKTNKLKYTTRRNIASTLEQLSASRFGSGLSTHKVYGNLFGDREALGKRLSEAMNDPVSFTTTAGIDNYVKYSSREVVKELNRKIRSTPKGKVFKDYRQYITDGKLNDLGKALIKDRQTQMAKVMQEGMERFKDDLPVLDAGNGKKIIAWEIINNSPKFERFKNAIQTQSVNLARDIVGLTPRTLGQRVLNALDRAIDVRYAMMLSGIPTSMKIITGTGGMRVLKTGENYYAQLLRKIFLSKETHLKSVANTLRYKAQPPRGKKGMLWLRNYKHLFKNFDGLVAGQEATGVFRTLGKSPSLSPAYRKTLGLKANAVGATLTSWDGILTRPYKAEVETTLGANVLKKAGRSKTEIEQYIKDTRDFYTNPAATGITEARLKWNKELEGAIQEAYETSASEAVGYRQGIVAKATEAVQEVKLASDDKFGGLAGKTADVLDKTRLSFLAPYTRVAFNFAHVPAVRAPLIGTLIKYADVKAAANRYRTPAQKNRLFSNAEVLAEHLAEQTTGFALISAGVIAAKNDLITLGYPQDAAGRETYDREGKIPFSINVGKLFGGEDHWWSPDVTATFMPLPAIGATIVEGLENNLVAGRDDTAFDVLVNALSESLSGFSEISFLQDLKTIQDLITPKEIDQDVKQTRGDILTKKAQEIARSFIPGLLTSIFNFADPTKKNPVTWQERIFRMFASDKTILGQKIYYNPWLYLLGITTGDPSYQNDPVFKEVDRLFGEGQSKTQFTVGEISPQTLSARLRGDLSYEDKRQLQASFMHKINNTDKKRIGDMNERYSEMLYDEISRWMATDQYKDASDQDKSKYINDIKNTIRSALIKDYLINANYGEYISDLTPKEEAFMRGEDVSYSRGAPKNTQEKIQDLGYKIEAAEPHEKPGIQRDIDLLEVQKRWEDEGNTEVTEAYNIGSTTELGDYLITVANQRGVQASIDLWDKVLEYSVDRRNTVPLKSAKYTRMNSRGMITPSSPPANWINTIGTGWNIAGLAGGGGGRKAKVFKIGHLLPGSTGGPYIRRRRR